MSAPVTPASAGTRGAPTTATSHRCLVVGYDGGEASRRAVRWAASRLAPHGKLVLVHAGRPLHAPPSPLSTGEERLAVGRALVDELLLEGDGALLETINHTDLPDADPVSALTSAALRYDADGIVVGHELHSRLHAAVGTVTSALLARSPVPVTVVPADAERV
jgi:nucleotide-binding universal stress UspA family protein